MKKVVTALIIVLPLLFLVALFAITSVASVSADIPANALVINNKGANGIFSFDLAKYEHKMFEDDLGVEVLPVMAKNKKYSLKITDANTGEDTDIVTREEDGSFAFHDVGVAKLTYTSQDGGYSDSVIFNVASSGVLSFNPVLLDSTNALVALEKGDDTDYKADITAGVYTLSGDFYPATATDVRATYTSENQDAISINEVSGKIAARFETDAVVAINLIDAFGNDARKTLKLNVRRTGDVMINGQQTSQDRNDAPIVSAPLGAKRFTFFVDCKGISQSDIDFADVGEKLSFEARKLSSVSDSAYAIDVELENPVTITTNKLYWVTINSQRYFLYVSFADHAFSVNSFGNADGNDDLVLLDETTTKFTVSSEPFADLEYVWEIADPSFATITEQSNEYCYIQAVKDGETELLISWKKRGATQTEGVIKRKLIVTKIYTSLIFNETAASHGLGNLAIANQTFSNGEIVKTEYTTKLFNNVLGKGHAQEEIAYPYDNVEFTSSNNSILEIRADESGVKLIVKGTGEVTVTANWKFGSRFNVKPTSFAFNAVDGVYVKNYEELKAATALKKQVVLADDIYLGEKLTDDEGNAKYDDAQMTQKLLSHVKKIKTTADYKYYSNLGLEQPEVYVGFEFENNVYGNGHFISAEYITDLRGALTDTVPSYAIFKGPLNFVAASMGGIDVASVKAQDNISFLVRKNGIVLDNLTLAGCDDDSLYVEDNDGNKKMELTLLNEKGTTLEVMCNATIKNCRIKNGRTVVRVFGRSGVTQESVNPQTERINVTIEGSRLHTAREFILKIGTNRFLRGNASDLAPSLTDKNGASYNNHNTSACDAYANDEYFMNNYVLTDVTLKDSVLSTSGLFSVGMESHFSGGMLDMPTMGFSYLNGWDGLAATSYPACLRLVGEVILDDWKELSQVDSSTLIEVNLQDNQQGLSWLELNIPEMLREMCNLPGNENIVSKINGKEYVHGGVAFYGGGKNYSILDLSGYTFESMNQYLVNIGVLANSQDSELHTQGQLLPLAAGTEDFRFVMFDATSKFNASSKH